MLSRHRVSRAAIELIKRFEGYRRNAAQLPDGRWTIGYGHTLTAREGAEVSEPDAEALLVYDLIAVQHAVNESVYAPLSQNQFDALCSFAFNVGLDNFRRSQVLKRLNAGAHVQAACAMELWRKTDFEGERIVLDALVRRRASEKAMFLSPDDGNWTPAPSPLLRPVIDLDALDLVPLRRPVEVETSLEGDRVTARREDIVEDEAPLVAEPALEPAHEDPLPAVTAAAEAISARLETIFADPGVEPEPEAEPPADVLAGPLEGPVIEEEALVAETAAFEGAAGDETSADLPYLGDPLADVAPQADVAEPEVEPEATSEPAAGFAPADSELDIPVAPRGSVFRAADRDAPQVNVEVAPYEFIPARRRPAPQPKEISVVWDLLLALLGLAFFGFGIFWGLNARAAPTGGFVTPIMVAWPAGLAGVGFVVVAVFRLLQRLGREAERD
ncbi:glycoside hydrolase family protein [Phenylobacterium sp.]|uniref:lysozyme n=1 Tax=Phenylobacterium sp. TaxID=1871053 RepID=UPI003D2BF63D